MKNLKDVIKAVELNTSSFIDIFFKKDILTEIFKLYQKVSDLDKKTFLIIFCFLNLVYLFNSVNLMFGDQDWYYVMHGIKYRAVLYDGRFGSTVINQILFNGNLLPFINNLIAFLFLSLSVPCILNYLNAPKNLSQRVITGLLLTLTPFNIITIWYPFYSIEKFAIPFFISIAFILTLRHKSFFTNILAIFLLTLSLGIYQPAIATILLLFVGKITVDSLDNNTNNIKIIFKKNLNTFINIVISCITYKIIYGILCYKKFIIPSFYSLELLPLKQIIPYNIIKTIKLGFLQIFDYPSIMVPSSFTKLYSVLFIILVLIALKKLFTSKSAYKIYNLFYYLFLFTVLILCCKIVSAITVLNVDYSIRIDFYGLVLFKAFMVLLIFKYGGQFTKNITYIITVFILWICITTNLSLLKAMKLGFDTEANYMNRIISQIYSDKDFNFDKNYKLISIGNYKSSLLNYIDIKDKNYTESLHSFISWNDPDETIIFFAPELNNITSKSVFKKGDDFELDTLTEEDKTLLKKVVNQLSSAPNRNVSIYDDNIIIVFNEYSLKILKNYLNQ